MPENPLSGYVYVLRTNTTINGEEVIKIGMTRTSVEKRVRQLRTGSPVQMDIAYALKVENAKAFERDLHLRYRGYRVRAGGGTEFFRISAAEVIRHIEEKATSISREKARAAYAADLAAFERTIGVAKIRKQIGMTCMGGALIVTALLSGFLFWAGRSGLGALGIFPGLIVWIWLGTKTEEFLEHHFIDVPFKSQLRSIRAQLTRKYPLANPQTIGSPNDYLKASAS
jgi:hypothetical protein